jgi:3-oxoacyl-[acyl-carrier-protein] synthase II
MFKLHSELEHRKVASFTTLALAASDLALTDAGYTRDVLDKLSRDEKDRMGLCLGMATPEVEHGQDALKEYNSKGPRKVPLLTLFKLSINIATGDLGLQYGLRGPTITMTAADSSSAYSVGNAFRIIRDGCADFMLTGGSEMRLTPSIIGLINRSVPLSAKFNDFPETSSRPFDRDRDGLVLAEGSAMLTLEEYEKAKARGAHIYCEVIGFGMSGDGRNLLGTAPPQDGKEAYRAMAAALKDAKEKPEAVRYVNAHAVSSRLGRHIPIMSEEDDFATFIILSR